MQQIEESQINSTVCNGASDVAIANLVDVVVYYIYSHFKLAELHKLFYWFYLDFFFWSFQLMQALVFHKNSADLFSTISHFAIFCSFQCFEVTVSAIWVRMKLTKFPLYLFLRKKILMPYTKNPMNYTSYWVSSQKFWKLITISHILMQWISIYIDISYLTDKNWHKIDILLCVTSPTH